MADPREAWEKEYRIRCSECGQPFKAKATFTPGDPFPNYTATCPFCEYVVMESEWEEA
jgi:hypothetical protein